MMTFLYHFLYFKGQGRVGLASLINAESSWLKYIKMTGGNVSTEIILHFYKVTSR